MIQPIARLIASLAVGFWILTAPVLAEGNCAQPLVHESPEAELVRSPAWEIGAQEHLAAREYWITWQDRTQLEDVPAAWHAPNRVQGLRTYFTPEGFRSIPRTGRESAWSWGLSLVAYGRGSISHAVEQARLFPDENRIRLDRQEIAEWFVNEPRGLKHGFVLLVPPDDGHRLTDGGRAVYLDLKVNGTLTPILEADGQSVRFEGPSGMGEVYYRDLEVRDALGQLLPAWMETHLVSGAWMIRLLVDDHEAAYPIEVDPLTTTAAWSAESDQESAQLGVIVGTAGDVNADGYDDVVVGAMRYDNGQDAEGAAFLYLGSATGPSTTYDWMVEGEEEVAYAGRAVGSAGDVNNDGYDDVIVGAFGHEPGGAAWVFHGSPTGPSAVADWVAHSNQFGSWFGFKTGTAGDVNNDGYDDVIVGARAYSSPGFAQDGQVFVYHGSADGLSTVPAWTESGRQDGAGYGISVSTAGDVNADGFDDVIVGAYWYDNEEIDQGRVFVYHGSASGLSSPAAWMYEINILFACLGGGVGTAGDVNADGYDDVIVGAAFFQCQNAPQSPLGQAHTFHGSASGLSLAPDWTAELVQTGALFGSKVATAGDVNNDGYDDVVVGASRYTNDQTEEGAAFLYLGSAAGLFTDHGWMVEGNQTSSRLGFGLGTAGDVNNDGYDDLIVGAPNYDNPESNEGAAFLYLGSPGSVVLAGSVPADTPLLLAKTVGSALQLIWGPSCLESDVDYEIYEGQLGNFASHEPRACGTAGATTFTLVPGSGGTYYLVVPASLNREGSYGQSTDGLERSPGTVACLPQVIGSCD